MSAAASHYALVLDAGSSGSRLRIFAWDEPSFIREQGRSTPHLRHQAECLRKRPGLSAFARNPAGAAKQVADLVACAKKLVPDDARSKAPLYVKATAGLRLVRDEQAEAVLEAVRGELSKGPFDFRGARIISGEEEAIFGWLSINHIRGFASTRRVGWLDLGGASSQIAVHVPTALERGDEALRDEALRSRGGVVGNLPLPGGQSVKLYRQSHLLFGREEAFRRTCRLLVHSSKKLRANRRSSGSSSSEAADDYASYDNNAPAAPSAPTRAKRTWEHPCLMRGDELTVRNVMTPMVGAAAAASVTAPIVPRRLSDATNRTTRRLERLRHLHNATFVGSGDPVRCAQLVAQLLPMSNAAPAAEASWDNPLTVVTPTTAAAPGASYFASSNYYYAAKFLGLTSSTSKAGAGAEEGEQPNGGHAHHHKSSSSSSSSSSSMLDGKMLLSASDYSAGANATCVLPWKVVRERWPASEWRHLRFVCFSGTYIARLLPAAYGLPLEAKALTTTRFVQHTTLDWTLGSLIHELHLANGGSTTTAHAHSAGRGLAESRHQKHAGGETPSSRWCLLGIAPASLCVLSSSWALALVLFAWPAGLYGVRRYRQSKKGMRSPRAGASTASWAV